VSVVHTVLAPVIATGEALTDTANDAAQPVGNVYTIDGVPAVTPVTTPAELTVACAVLLLVHVPPDVISANAVVRPVQTLLAPVIPAGNALTVNGKVATQPVGSV
jgi:hypothetical protein